MNLYFFFNPLGEGGKDNFAGTARFGEWVVRQVTSGRVRPETVTSQTGQRRYRKETVSDADCARRRAGVMCVCPARYVGELHASHFSQLPRPFTGRNRPKQGKATAICSGENAMTGRCCNWQNGMKSNSRDGSERDQREGELVPQQQRPVYHSNSPQCCSSPGKVARMGGWMDGVGAEFVLERGQDGLRRAVATPNRNGHKCRDRG